MQAPHCRNRSCRNLQAVSSRDGNSSENFIPWGIEESRNDKFTFLGDRGICYLFLGVLGEFRGMSYPKNPKIPLKNWKKFEKKNSKKFFSTEFVLQSSECLVIIPKINHFSWKTEIKTEKSWQIAENFLIFSFLKCSKRNFGISEVLGEFWRGIEEPRSYKIYSLGNRGVKKGPGPWEMRNR